jgi:hypothetical protein
MLQRHHTANGDNADRCFWCFLATKQLQEVPMQSDPDFYLLTDYGRLMRDHTSRCSRDSSGFIILPGNPSRRLGIEEITQFSTFYHPCIHVTKRIPGRRHLFLNSPLLT